MAVCKGDVPRICYSSTLHGSLPYPPDTATPAEKIAGNLRAFGTTDVTDDMHMVGGHTPQH